MNKIAAKKAAQEEKFSVGQLRKMISERAGKGGASQVNPAIPIGRACEIYTAALEGRADDEMPRAWRRDPYSRRGDTVKPTRDVLLVTNILRDCS